MRAASILSLALLVLSFDLSERDDYWGRISDVCVEELSFVFPWDAFLMGSLILETVFGSLLEPVLFFTELRSLIDIALFWRSISKHVHQGSLCSIILKVFHLADWIFANPLLNACTTHGKTVLLHKYRSRDCGVLQQDSVVAISQSDCCAHSGLSRQTIIVCHCSSLTIISFI